MKLLYVLILLLTVDLFAAQLKNIEHSYQGQDLMISLKMDEAIKFKQFALNNPFRVVIDLESTAKGDQVKPIVKVKDGFLKAITTTSFKRRGVQKTRILFEFNKKSVYTVDQFGNSLLFVLKGAKPAGDAVANKIEKIESGTSGSDVDIDQQRAAYMGGKNEITKVSHEYQGKDLIVAIEMSEGSEYKAFHLAEPFRLIVDIADALPGVLKKKHEIKDDFLDKIVSIPYKKGKNNRVKLILFGRGNKTYNVERIGKNILIKFKDVRRVTEVVQNEIVNDEVVAENKIQSFKYKYTGRDLAFTVKLDKMSKYKYFHLVEPFRVVLDFQDTVLEAGIKEETSYNDSYLEKVSAISYSRKGKKGTKIILYLAQEQPYTVEDIGSTFLINIKNAKVRRMVATVDTPTDTNDHTENVAVVDDTLDNGNTIDLGGDTTDDSSTNKPVSVNNNPVSQTTEMMTDAPTVIDNRNDVTITSNEAYLVKVGFRKYRSVTRVTVETTEATTYEVTSETGIFKLLLKNTRPKGLNSRLPLDTSFFNSVVKRIEPTVSGETTTISIFITKDQEPSVTRSNNKLHIDFKE